MDIILYLGPVDPDITSWFREGFRLVSLDNGADPGHRFLQDGIRFIVPRMRPVIIPPRTYFSLPGNEQALHTLAVDILLVARKDVPVIYQLIRTLIEEKPRLAALEPNLFDGINESSIHWSSGFRCTPAPGATCCGTNPDCWSATPRSSTRWSIWPSCCSPGWSVSPAGADSARRTASTVSMSGS